MILTRLVDPGGGSSRLVGLVQRCLRPFRQAFHGAKKAPDQTPVRSCPQPVPAVGESALVAVGRGARDILSAYLARTRIQGVAAEMSRRYAFRLMSGPARSIPVLMRNRIAIYGFVGLSLGNAVCNRDAQLHPTEDGHRIQKVKELFSPEPHAEFVSKAVEEDDTFAAAELKSISSDSDFAILSDDDSDFEILQSTEVFVIEAEDDCVDRIAVSDVVVSGDEVMELQELMTLETEQQAEIHSLMQKLCQENKALKDFINAQVGKENLLKTELTGILTSTNQQQRELFLLRDLVVRQNAALTTLYNQRKCSRSTTYAFKAAGQHPQQSGIPTRNMVGEKECLGSKSSDSLENYRERLRAAGGRVRALKIHRKQRLKRN